MADPNHLLPSDLLPGARSVVAFFLPFDEAVVRANRRRRAVAPEWVLAYRETNALIADITRRLTDALAERGVRAAAQPPTHNFDPVTLSCRWSHRSAAFLAGLGTFGLHRLLITEAGCAGRFGSLVLDASLPPTPPPAREHCLHFAGAKCRACVDGCPVGALTVA
ncbi:MAG: epoxyqueuosine reductase, partial [Deltaproteobacteria bacterium]|nr:epoxyqueuosine reductase [Deltaproteobacteria bacterium]